MDLIENQKQTMFYYLIFSTWKLCWASCLIVVYEANKTMQYEWYNEIGNEI